MNNQNPSQLNREQFQISTSNYVYIKNPLTETIFPATRSSVIEPLQAESTTNRAPILTDRNVSLNPIDEDAPSPSGSVGTLVSSLIPFVNDPDPGALKGVAITEFNRSNGDWWFSIDDGTTWQKVDDEISPTNSLLLAEGTNSRLYFQPNPNYNGSITNALTFRAWDLTTDENGQTGDTSINGGSSAFSAFSDTASLLIEAVNDAPFNTVPSGQSTNEDQRLIFTGENRISVTDIDAGNGTIQVRLQAQNGIIVVASSSGVGLVNNRTANVVLTDSQENINQALDGLEFRPNRNFNGSTKLIITTNDQGRTGKGGIQTKTNEIEIDVKPVNDPPSFIRGANLTISEDAGTQEIPNWATSISRGAPDEEDQELEFILMNDRPSLFTIDGQPRITPDGTLIYTPAPDGNGIAQVTVFLRDGQAENNSSPTQTFTIRINAVNDAPMNIIPVAEGESLLINEDETIIFSRDRNNAIQVTDVDAGTNNIQVTLSTPNGRFRLGTNENITVRTNSPGSLTLTGTVTNINTALDGLAFTPSSNFNGTTSISIITNDQGNTGSGGARRDEDTINIEVRPVNDAPSFTRGGNITVNEDDGEQSFSRWVTRISAGPSDEAGQVLTFNVTNDNNALFTEDGQPKITPDGTLTFTPADNMNGVATVTVTLQDDGGRENGGVDTSLSQEFTINVRAVNDPPVNLVPPSQEIDEDEFLEFSTLNNNAIRIEDIDAEDQPIRVTLTTQNGMLSLSEGMEFAGATENETGNLVLNGSLEEINHVLEGLRFTPTLDFNGNARIRISTTDLGNTGIGGAQRVTNDIGIVVRPVNDAPFFTKGNNITVREDAGLRRFRNWATKISPGAFDEFDQNLEFIVTNDNNALFTEDGQPTISEDGTLTFKARDNANGMANVTVILKDDGEFNNTSVEQTFTINVTAVNDPPINRVPTEVQTIDEDQPLVFSSSNGNGIEIEDIDAGDNPIFVGILAPHGSLALTNISTNEFFTVEGEGTDILTINGAIADINFVLDGLVFTPNPDFNGETEILIYTSDKGFTGDDGVDKEDRSVIPILIQPVNDAPFFMVGEDIEIDEDAGLQVLTNWVTDISPGADNESKQKLQFIISNDNPELFTSTGQPTIDSQGTLTFQTADNANGIVTVTVKLMDNGGRENEGMDTSEEQIFAITVKPVNDPPVNNIPTAPITVLEDGQLTFTEANQIFVTDVDSEGNPLSVTLNARDGILGFGNTGNIQIEGENTDTATIRGTLAEINIALATLIFRPTPDFYGATSIEIETQDETDNLSDRSTININVLPVNDAPSFTPGENIFVNAGMGSQNIPNWGQFSPGPDNESEQTVLEYIIDIDSIDKPELFTVAPSIDKDGNLSFTPSGKVEKTTTAKIGVKVRDNGGTENDGVNISSENFFQITVNPLTVNLVAGTESLDEGNDGTTNYEFTLNLSAANTEEVTVRYRTFDRTATVADDDYIPITEGAVTFQPGETSKTIAVKVKGDTKFEQDETFGLELIGVTNAALGENRNAVVTIGNDDSQPVISFTQIDIQTREGNVGETPVNIQLNLSNRSDEEITVSYNTVDGTANAGSDYTRTSGMVTFAPGELTKSITVQVTGDTFLEPNETFLVELTNPTAASLNSQASTATITILNDEIVNDTDFNRDRKADIFWRNYRTGENAVWLMDGHNLVSGEFVNPIVTDVNWRIEQIADFNGDDNLDLLWRYHGTGADQGKNAIWLMDNRGQFVRSEFILTVEDLGWQPVATADFSGNGKTDIYWRNQRTGQNAIWEMDGFNLSNAYFVPNRDVNMQLAGVGDFNGDLVIDIVWHNYRTGENMIQFRGNTPANLIIDQVPDLAWKIVGVADFNHDASPDLLWRNSTTGENAIWFMQGAAINNPVFITQVPNLNWQIQRLADYNGDGKMDILWRNYSTGENAIWHMEGDRILDARFLIAVDDTNWEIV